MATKTEIISWFDGLAAQWDTVQYEKKAIDSLLTAGNIRKGKRVLDVGCATGVLIPFLLEKDVAEITAMDFSPEMITLANKIFGNDARIDILCADIMETHFSRKFDCIILNNVLPYVEDLNAVIRHVSHQLVPFGTLVVGSGYASPVSESDPGNRNLTPLMIETAMTQYFKVQTAISEPTYTTISGIKKPL